MNILEIISMVLGTGILTTIVTHILTKRKYKAEVDKLSTEVQGDTIGNMDKSLDFYEKWVSNTNKRLDEVLRNQDRLIGENASLRNELNTVKEQTTRMSALLCTNLPCNQRVIDSSIIDCVYLKGSKRQARKLAKQQNKKNIEN
jgi:hypothetical protein